MVGRREVAACGIGNRYSKPFARNRVHQKHQNRNCGKCSLHGELESDRLQRLQDSLREEHPGLKCFFDEDA